MAAISSYTKYFLAFALALGLSLTSLQAKHIIGGVMNYECLGNDRYQITLRVYRDCNCTGCANFDPTAYMAVYNCSDNCFGQSQGTPFMEIDAQVLEVTSIPPDDYPCLVPPNVCVQEGIYQFTVELPRSDESYFIAYQRCCRNETVTNLIAPGDTGATYFVEITPEAQQVCNSSPVFNDFPPIVICAGAPIEFDHSATDPDGDQLVYSLCSSYDGGGNLLSEGYNTCIGAQPDPACPPPYDNINFLGPNYSPVNPMGVAANLQIDPNTGMLTGLPTDLGQFIVAICVEEYRNGELLSRTVRDFQFNVARCDPTVVAQIDATEVTAAQEYLVVSCGENTVNFRNQSFQQSNIDNYSWTFQINGQEETFGEWQPSVTFPDTGLYLGKLILNPNTLCGDTADIQVRIFPGIEADFTYEYDTCTAGPTVFSDFSVSGSGQITDWEWAFGDGGSSDEQEPIYRYPDPGTFPVALTVTDINGCQDTEIQELLYYPVPELIVIAPSEFLGCVPARIFFDNLSTPISEEYDILWEFGDGGIGTDISPTHTYEQPGTYTVSVDIVSPLGCQTDTTFNNLITVRPAPIAGFSYRPQRPSNIEPTVSFFDESIDAIRWFYDFGDDRLVNERNPIHTFRDTGLYEIKQIVVHPSGCRDTAIQVLDVRPDVRYFLPNAFTPNEDGTNDVYRGAGVLAGISNFRMLIFNRWGEVIFETADPMAGWNGRKQNIGQPVQAGVYMVLVTFTGPRGGQFEYKGSATVVR